jgi:2-iminobutanoate/2-iminopropanoate deaminase
MAQEGGGPNSARVRDVHPHRPNHVSADAFPSSTTHFLLYQVSYLMLGYLSSSVLVRGILRRSVVSVVLLVAACGQQRGERPMGPMPLGMADLEEKKFINSSSVGGLEGFTQAIKVGKRVYLSGQVGVDSNGTIAGTDLASQAAQAFRNVSALMNAAGGTPDDIVRLDIYVIGLKEGDVSTIRAAGGALFTGAHAPAGSVMGIQALPLPGLLIAINATAETKGLFPDREVMRRYQQ